MLCNLFKLYVRVVLNYVYFDISLGFSVLLRVWFGERIDRIWIKWDRRIGIL